MDMGMQDGKRPCVESVQRSLSDVFVMYFMAHTFHWNVKGATFKQYHDFFRMISDDVYGSVDDWAENLLKLGADAPYNLDEILDRASYQEVAVTDDPMQMLQTLYGANQATLESLTATFRLANELGYDGLADYAAGRIDMHNKWAWQIRVSMGSNGDPSHVGQMPGKSEADQPVDAIEIPSVVADQHVPDGVAYKVNNPEPEDDDDDDDRDEVEFDPIFFAAEGKSMTAAAEGCPPATQDIALNLKNRKNAIDTAMYGPLNPAEPNDEYWQALADEWSVTPEDAKKQTCGNCAAFNISPKMKDCIASGLTGEQNDEFDSIDAAGELGYCEAFDFKCASARTCRAWISGGPVTAAAKKTGASTPAPKKDQIKGSDANKPGSADGKGKIKFSDKTETALRNKVEEHNKTAPKGRKTTIAMLKAVYRRGAGAYSTSHRPGKTRDQWAMARVNAFLKLLRSGKPDNSAYTTDNDLLPASHPKSSKKSNSAITASALVPEERDMANAILEVVAKHGKFDEDGTGVWAGYIPADENDRKEIGVYCEHCVFYQGGDSCAIISLPVEPEGMCRLAMIPDGLIGEDHEERERISELEVASIAAEMELSVELRDESEYETPEDAIFAMTEFSGLGYEVEPAFRASWLRAVRAGDRPFARAKHLAEFTYNSLDADLLPREKKGN